MLSAAWDVGVTFKLRTLTAISCRKITSNANSAICTHDSIILSILCTEFLQMNLLVCSVNRDMRRHQYKYPHCRCARSNVAKSG